VIIFWMGIAAIPMMLIAAIPIASSCSTAYISDPRRRSSTWNGRCGAGSATRKGGRW
jgi:hypothetical protein